MHDLRLHNGNDWPFEPSRVVSTEFEIALNERTLFDICEDLISRALLWCLIIERRESSAVKSESKKKENQENNIDMRSLLKRSDSSCSHEGIQLNAAVNQSPKKCHVVGVVVGVHFFFTC